MQDGRGRVGFRHGVLPLAPPADATGALVDRDCERSAALVADQRDDVAVDDGRRREAVEAVERPEREPPALVPVEVERDEAEIRKEDVEALAVRGRCRTRGVVADVGLVGVVADDVAPPGRLSRPKVEGQRRERVTLHGRQVDPVLDDDRRRPAHGHGDAPHQVLSRPELCRQGRPVGYPVAMRSPEARPLLRRDVRPDEQAQAERKYPAHVQLVSPILAPVVPLPGQLGVGREDVLDAQTGTAGRW